LRFGELRLTAVAGYFDLDFGLRQFGLLLRGGFRAVEVSKVHGRFFVFGKSRNLFNQGISSNTCSRQFVTATFSFDAAGDPCQIPAVSIKAGRVVSEAH
jgi:hypothetical protein